MSARFEVEQHNQRLEVDCLKVSRLLLPQETRHLLARHSAAPLDHLSIIGTT
jgi:hypothetical protein